MQVPPNASSAAPTLPMSAPSCHRGRKTISRILCVGVLFSISLFASPSFAQRANEPPARAMEQRDNLQDCRSISDCAEQLHCYEKAAVDESKGLEPVIEGGWRLIRTVNPAGGPDAVSIMRSADITQSDPDLAGLMVRCAPKQEEVLIVMIKPLAPGTRPRVDIGPAGRTTSFTATVLPPGLVILLPDDAAALVQHQWQKASALSIAIGEGQTKVRGFVPMAGLQAAFQLLLANCSP